MLKKFITSKKGSASLGQNAQEDELDPKIKKDLDQKKELDKKLVHSLNTKKIPSFKQIKHFGKTLNSKQRKIVLGLTGLVLICIIIIGCNFYLRNFIPTPTFGGEYTEGLIGAPQYINPILSQTNDVDSDISRLIFSGLLKYDSNLQLVPDLASSWEQSADQTSYTFTIKDNLKWHDGTPLTIDDLLFTFQSIKDPDFKSPLLISFRGVEIEKIDEKTIKFILPEAYPAFLEVLTVGILPEHIWGDIPPINANLTEYNLKPIGSGPWKFRSLAKDRLGNIKSYTLIPNPDYYGPKPYIQEINFKFYPDFETGVQALKNHSTEGISFLPKDLKSELNARKKVNYYSFYLPQYTAIFFNQKANEVLKSKSIRKALALSIDKSNILTEALQLEGEIIDGPILPTEIYQDPSKKINFDIDQANQLLDELGWKQITPEQYDEFIQKKLEKEIQNQEEDKQDSESQKEEINQEENQTEEHEDTSTTTKNLAEQETEDTKTLKQSFYRQKDDQILEVTLTTVNQPENTKAAELIKESWETIGVKVNLNIVEGSKISREVIKPRNYEILLFGIIVGSNPDPYPFWHSSQIQDPGLNLSMLANRNVDKFLEDAKTTSDPEKQKELYQRFYDILTSEIPAIFLHNPTYTYVVDKKIKGIYIDRIIVPADRFNNIEDWYIKTKRRWQGSIDNIQ